jgi:segregation and condensation protein B
MDQDLIQRIVEAALLASPQPLTPAQLTALFTDEDGLTPGAVEQALAALREQSAERGVELVEVASGFRYQVRADVHGHVARLWTERQAKYTRATLETLALIAYRQPITRGEIEQIRGVGVSASTIKLLEEREWIRVIGHRDVPGRPELFGTTRAFLDYFGLKSLDGLPPLSELKDIPELEPQFPFDAPPGVAAAAMAAALDDQYAPDDDAAADDADDADDIEDVEDIDDADDDASGDDADAGDVAADTARSDDVAPSADAASDDAGSTPLSTQPQDAGEAVAPEHHS